jgi:endonuclease YncB( thermonuclease family)
MGNLVTRWKLAGKTFQTTKAFELTGRFKLCRVLYVHDGDTICLALRHRSRTWKINGRLYGINAPELRPSQEAANRQQIILKAARARDILREKCLTRNVIVEFHDVDRFGRWLCTLYTESRGKKRENINDYMVQQGHCSRFYEEIQVLSPTDAACDKAGATKNSEDMIKIDNTSIPL